MSNLNDVFTVRFGGGDWYKGKVSEFIPDKKIVWEVIDSHKTRVKDATEWTDTKILWEVSAQKDGTRIDMTHTGRQIFVSADLGALLWSYRMVLRLIPGVNSVKLTHRINLS